MNKRVTFTLIVLSFCMNTVSSLLFADDLKGSQVQGSYSSSKPQSLLQRIIDNYVDASNTDITLKHLLDAKMYLSTAEHDLLVSLNKKQAHKDITSSLHFLSEAVEVSKPNNKVRISKLIETLKTLAINTDGNDVQAEKNANEMDALLASVRVTLSKAEKIASPDEVQDLTKINAIVQQLRKKVEYGNLRNDYEKSMETLNSIINSL